MTMLLSCFYIFLTPELEDCPFSRLKDSAFPLGAVLAVIDWTFYPISNGISLWGGFEVSSLTRYATSGYIER